MIPSHTDASPHADLESVDHEGPPYLYVSLLHQRHAFLGSSLRQHSRTKDLRLRPVTSAPGRKSLENACLGINT